MPYIEADDGETRFGEWSDLSPRKAGGPRTTCSAFVGPEHARLIGRFSLPSVSGVMPAHR